MKARYIVGSNQFRKSPKRDIGAYLIAYLYVMILMVALYDIQLLVKPSYSEASDTKTVKVAPAAAPAESKQVVVQVATPAATFKSLTRVEKLETYLKENNSPLADYADYIVEMADKYDISYTLSVAIALKESSLETAGDTTDFNAWGIMTWDLNGKRSIRKFTSWKESIKYHTALISNSYRVNMNKAIQEKYCPSFECSDSWVAHVTGAQKEINN